MLTDYELDQYFEAHGVPYDARAYIRRSRANGPAREVGKYANGNVVAQFNSTKMGRPITLESHSIELVFARMCEFDDNILEYHDQPGAINIYPEDKNGKKRCNTYNTDFLILTTSGPRVVQTKSQRELKKLVERQPGNWEKRGETYVHKPALEAFSGIGLKHQVTHIDSWASLVSVNLGLILQAKTLDPEELQSRIFQVGRAFADKAWMTLDELAASMRLESLEPIFSLLKAKKLYSSLYKQLLSEPSAAIITTNPQYLEHAIQQFEQSRLVTSDIESTASIALVPSPLQAEKAVEAMERINDGSRTARRYKARIAEGKKYGLSAFQALIPRIDRRGNRNSKLAQEVKSFLADYLDSKDFSDARDISKNNAYAEYTTKAKCAHEHLKPASFKTFSTYIAELDQVEHARRRKGRRGANAAKSPSETSLRIIKDTVPFALTTIDHYNIDLHIVLGRDGKHVKTAKCWLSALIDLATKEVLGWYISLHPPSRVSCAMVIRDCIRRHGRVPAVIITDRGQDFRSHYFSAMLRNFDIERRLRPASESKYGAEVERLFLEFKQEHLDRLPGNTKGIAHNRSVSSSHSPTNTATLLPEDLLYELDLWLSWRRTQLIGAAIETTEEKVESKSNRFDFIGTKAVLDHTAYVLTAITDKRYKVDPQRGIHTGDGLHFWHPRLAEVKRGGRVEVRKEPEDPYRIYALVNGSWITCTSSGESVFQSKGNIAQKREAFLFFTPHSIKYERRLEAKQRLIAMQGSLADDEARVFRSQSTPPLDQPPQLAESPFDSAELTSDDELELEEWED